MKVVLWVLGVVVVFVVGLVVTRFRAEIKNAAVKGYERAREYAKL